MRALLISANTERLNMPTMPLGLGFVAAAARRAGHEVTFLDLMHAGEPLAALEAALDASTAEVIGISVRNVDDQELGGPRFLLEPVKEVVDACRARSSAPIVLGGAGYSLFPDAALRYLGADYGVRGDGEAAFVELLRRLEVGAGAEGIPGVHSADRPGEALAPAAPDLTDLTSPDEAFWATVDPATADLWVPIQTRRGCPNRCAYCSTASIQGRRIRTRPVEPVVREVAQMAAAGFEQFYFVDNVFNQPETHALELCRGLARLEAPIRWRCILYPEPVSTDLLDAMVEAGCVEVALGFESGAEPVLAALNKRFTPEDVRHLAGQLAARGIRRMGFLLLGGPEETVETVERSFALARELDLDLIRITLGLRIYPETALASRARAEGVIAAGDDLLRPRFYLAPALREAGVADQIPTGVFPGRAIPPFGGGQ